MKTFKILFSTALTFSVFAARAQSTTAGKYQGEDFSLEGALAMFKQAKSPEEFEQLINEEGNNVNNLDLNNDGEIDYITVNDLKDGDTHVLVLSTYLDNNEKQDIATIGIEKTGAQSAVLQIEGDEDLYADGSIVEPQDTKTTIKDGKGPDAGIADVHAIVVNVWIWPAVQFIYAPAYVVYVSPWYYRAYPVWYRPWRPVTYTVFYGHCAPYRAYYRPAPRRRVMMAHRVYSPQRRTAVMVHNNSPRRNVAVSRYSPSRSANMVRSNGNVTRNRVTGNNATGNSRTLNVTRGGGSRNASVTNSRGMGGTRMPNANGNNNNRNTTFNSGRNVSRNATAASNAAGRSRNTTMMTNRNTGGGNAVSGNRGGTRGASHRGGRRQ